MSTVTLHPPVRSRRVTDDEERLVGARRVVGVRERVVLVCALVLALGGTAAAAVLSPRGAPSAAAGASSADADGDDDLRPFTSTLPPAADGDDEPVAVVEDVPAAADVPVGGVPDAPAPAGPTPEGSTSTEEERAATGGRRSAGGPGR